MIGNSRTTRTDLFDPPRGRERRCGIGVLPPVLASNRRGCTIGVLRRLIGVCTRLRLPSS
jgi:hypothetical protein